MWGIFGIITLKDLNIYSLLIHGLTQLLNRGYDSAGLCVMNGTSFEIHKYSSTNELCAIDKLKSLDLKEKKGTYIGFGHNRWATHGIKNDINAHPHLSNMNNFCVVHNGIIENYNELKNMLLSHGYLFSSQTDTEIIVNLIEFNFKKLSKYYFIDNIR